MKNKYLKWNPLEGIPSHLSCEGIYDDYEGFRILLKGDETTAAMLRITFDAASAYRNIDEGDLLRTITAVKDTGKSSLYTVENSSWIEWFREESLGKHSKTRFIHYAIYTENDCIDVITEFEPEVEWLN